MQLGKSDGGEIAEPLFSAVEAKAIFENMVVEELEQDYLTWMTPQLRQELYKCKLDPAESHFFQAVRQQFGVDCPINKKQAIRLYEQSSKYGHVIGYSKAILLKAEQDESGIDFDKAVFGLIKCGSQRIEDIRSSFWNYLASDQNSQVHKFKQVVKRYSKEGSAEYIYLSNLLNLAEGPEDTQLIKFISAIRTVTLSERMPSAAYFQLFMLELIQGTDYQGQDAFIPDYIDICQQHKFYRAYNACAKHLMKLHRDKEAMLLAQQGYQNGDQYSLTWLLAHKIRLCGATDFQGLEQVMEMETISSLAQHTNIYEFVFIHNLLKRKFKDYKKIERYNWIQRQLKIVLEGYNAKQNPFLRLPTDYMLMVYYDQQKYDLEEKDKIITGIVSRLKKKESRRLCIYFLNKIRRKRFRKSLQQDPEESEVMKVHLKDSEEQFAQISLATLNDKQYPTNFFRLAKCYQMGFGVEVNMKFSYIIYCKVMSQFDRKTSDQDQVLHMSFVNFYSFEKTKRRIQKVKKAEQVTKFLNKLKQQHTHQCQICLEQHTDIAFFPCLHLFCNPCYNTLKNYQEKCPKCRARIMFAVPLKYLM